MSDSPQQPSRDADSDLRARIRRGDHAAFEELFRAHYERLVRFANRLIAAQMEAEEVVQDVLLNVWLRREQLQSDEDLKTYLFRATRNRALNHLRRRRLENLWRRALPAEEPSTPAPTGEDVSVTEAAIRAAIDALPDRCREVFVLSREHELTYAAIAATMGISIKTVETQMGRALKALRIALEPFREG